MALSKIDGTNLISPTIPVASGGTGVTTSGNIGNLVLLNTVTTTDATTTNIDFDSTYITSTYVNYIVYINVKPVTDGTNLRLRFFVGGTIKDGSSDYGVGVLTEGAASLNDNDLAYIPISSSNVGNANGESVFIKLELGNLTSSTFSSGALFNNTSLGSTHLHTMRFGSGIANYQEANDGIRFYWGSGNFASGSTISLYGVKS